MGLVSSANVSCYPDLNHAHETGVCKTAGKFTFYLYSAARPPFLTGGNKINFLEGCICQLCLSNMPLLASRGCGCGGVDAAAGDVGEVPRGAVGDGLAGWVEWVFTAVPSGDRGGGVVFFGCGICEPHARAARFFTGFVRGG